MITSRLPNIPEVGVLAYVYHEWGAVWMTPHHVLTRLAEYFHIVWMDPCQPWSKPAASWRRMQEFRNGNPQLPAAFDICPPTPWFPEIYRPHWARDIIFDMRLRSGRKRLENRGCRTYILYLWHPKFEKALESSGFDLRLYHIDDEYSFSSEPLPPDEREVRVIRSVDQVFAISPGLLERKGGINPRTDFAPEGVEYALYATPIDEPSDLARVPHPRIGYTGVLKKQLDWPLLRDLSLRHPEWSFVFVGPLNPHPEFHGIFQEMQGLPNVHFLGAKTVKDLASYPQHFDVCIMPYHVNWYTDNIYPLKLHEYLAGGRPVVGSPIRSLRDFQGVISLASTPEEWSQAIRYALSGEANTPAVRSSRQSMARRYDWNRLVHGIARTICARLGPGYEDRLTQI